LVDVPGVLGNDSDADSGQTLTAVLVSGPTHAAVNGFTLQADGSFTYTPTVPGVDTFTYKVFDGVLYGPEATVTITTLAPNATLVSALDASSAVSGEAVPGGPRSERGTDSGQTLTAVLVSGPTHAAVNGFTLQADGSFMYTPVLGFTGVDSFFYQAT